MVSSQPAVDSEVPLVAGAWRKPLRFIQVEVRFTPSTTSAYARLSSIPKIVYLPSLLVDEPLLEIVAEHLLCGR